MLRPEDLITKQFRKTLLGYDPEQVDAFLDELIEQLTNMEAERREMTDTIDRLAVELSEANKTADERRQEQVVEPVLPYEWSAKRGRT